MTSPLDFKDHYGNIMKMLNTDVEDGALNNLVQFYDPLYRCFTFLYYYLEPTLEEYAYLIGLSVSDQILFSGLYEIPKAHVIGGAIHLRKKILRLIL